MLSTNDQMASPSVYLQRLLLQEERLLMVDQRAEASRRTVQTLETARAAAGSPLLRTTRYR
jgi:uncharacterized membrane protein